LGRAPGEATEQPQAWDHRREQAVERENRKKNSFDAVISVSRGLIEAGLTVIKEDWTEE